MAEFILVICSRVYLLLLCRLFAGIYFELSIRLFFIEIDCNCKASDVSFILIFCKNAFITYKCYNCLIFSRIKYDGNANLTR